MTRRTGRHHLRRAVQLPTRHAGFLPVSFVPGRATVPGVSAPGGPAGVVTRPGSPPARVSRRGPVAHTTQPTTEETP